MIKGLLRKKIRAFWPNFIYIVLTAGIVTGFIFIAALAEFIFKYMLIVGGILFWVFFVLFFANRDYLVINLEEKSMHYKKSGLKFREKPWDEWNNNVYFSQVESIETVKLEKEERKNRVGRRRIFHKYLKINLTHNRQKYFYISMFPKWQIKKLKSYIKQISPYLEIN